MIARIGRRLPVGRSLTWHWVYLRHDDTGAFVWVDSAGNRLDLPATATRSLAKEALMDMAAARGYTIRWGAI